MANDRKPGLAPLPATLLRPAPAPEPEAPLAEAIEADGQSRGDAPSPAPAARARRRRPPAGKVRSRNLHLPDEVHDRLWQLAHQRRQSVSIVATEILDRALPRFRVEREG
jgi:hypothetical protein